MVYTIGRMLDTDVQRIGASRSTVFLAADFEIQLAIEEQMEQMDHVNDSPAMDDEQQNEMDLDQVELAEETAVVPSENIATPTGVGKPQQGDEPILADENASREDEDEDSFETMRRLNPNVDVTPALRFEPDESKLLIQLTHPNGQITPYRYCDPVDWTQPVKKLNKWRYAVFQRYFGLSASPHRLHPLEIQYILDAPNHPEKWGYGPNRSRVSWVLFQKAFNEKFQGKALPGYPGPRPARSVTALRQISHHYCAVGTGYRTRTRRQENHASEGQ